MKFSVEIDDVIIRKLSPAVQTKLRDDSATADAIAEFALKEMLIWMAGEATYQSLTQQYTEWITDLLPRFFGDKPPSVTQIYNAFSVPYGRAAYIARVLVEKEQSVWRLRGKASLLAALQSKNDEATANLTKGEGFRIIKLLLDTVAYRELTVVLDQIYEDAPLALPANGHLATPGRYAVDMPSENFQQLIHRLTP